MKRFALGAGCAAMIAGLALMAFAFAGGTPATRAGEDPCFTPDPSPTADPTIEVFGRTAGDVSTMGDIECATATPTTRRRTATPEATATPEPSTPEPSTPEPQPTEPPPAPTSPGGGAAGGGLQPPDTGDGSAAAASRGTWLLALGAALLAGGSGMVLVGAKRRSP